MHLHIPMRSVGMWSLQNVWARRVPHILFPNIFHGERSELREKYGLGKRGKAHTCRESGSFTSLSLLIQRDRRGNPFSPEVRKKYSGF